ncbi:hypothetical protein BsWGS_04244 [Bradybaena similaris]
MADDKTSTDTMKELRDWLVTKCRLPGFGNDHDRNTNGGRNGRGGTRDRTAAQSQQIAANLVTPRNIPQFVIPGSNDSSRQPSIGSNDDLVSHSSGEPSAASWSVSTSPGVSPRSSFSALAAPDTNNARIRSAPVSPRRDSHGFLKDFGTSSMSNLPHVQVDQAPAVKNGNAAVPMCKISSCSSHLIKEHKTATRKGSLTIPGSESRHRTRRIHRSFQDFSQHLDERNLSSDLLHVNHFNTEYRGAYTGLTDKNEYLPLKETFSRSKRYYRRRSSLVTSDVMRLLYRDPNTTENKHSPDGSPQLPRTRKQLTPIDPLQDKRHSSPEVTVCESKILEQEMSRSIEKSKSNSLSNISSHDATEIPAITKTETERGDIKFSFQYFPATKRLKVIIIRAEGLRFPEKPDLVLNPFFKLCLMPGKLQKQNSEPAKQTCAPILNKEFFFTDFNLDEMKTLRLRILAFHKAHHLKLPEYLGEVNVPLSNYDLLMENRMWNDLHFKPYKKDLGHLQIELQLDTRQSRLLVGVNQARGLPSQHLTGAPDPYVKVTLWQFGEIVAQFQTAVKKNTTAPSFNETFEFQINVRSKPLSHTRVAFDIHDRDRLRGDPHLGQVIMGLGSTEESVMEHWEEAMFGNGRKICRWHYIMDKGETHDY